jgi:hypothetical protein
MTMVMKQVSATRFKAQRLALLDEAAAREEVRRLAEDAADREEMRVIREQMTTLAPTAED